MADINKKTLEYLAELGKIRVEQGTEEKMIQDLESIVAYVGELKQIDVKGIEPLTGGTAEKNIFREDVASKKVDPRDRKKLIGQFRKEEKGFLKVPAVFE